MKIFTDEFLREFKPLSVMFIQYDRVSETKEDCRDKVRKSEKVSGKRTKKSKGKKEKKTGKVTINKKFNRKSRQTIQRIYKNTRRKVRPMQFNKSTHKRTSSKTGEEKRQVGRGKL